MARSRKTTKADIDVTPIPIDNCFSLGDKIAGRLTGNARTQDAELIIFFHGEEDAGHLSIKNFDSLLILLDALQNFISQMQSRRVH